MTETKNSETNQRIDITKCFICSELFTDARFLPCADSFCLKCLQVIALESSKKAGDQLPCPICKTEFTIPSVEGLIGLRRNVFAQRLVEMVIIYNADKFKIKELEQKIEEQAEELKREKQEPEKTITVYSRGPGCLRKPLTINSKATVAQLKSEVTNSFGLGRNAEDVFLIYGDKVLDPTADLTLDKADIKNDTYFELYMHARFANIT